MFQALSFPLVKFEDLFVRRVFSLIGDDAAEREREEEKWGKILDSIGFFSQPGDDHDDDDDIEHANEDEHQGLPKDSNIAILQLPLHVSSGRSLIYVLSLPLI